MMDQLGKLSNKKNYSYDQNDWDDIQSELITSIIILFEKFDKKNGKRIGKASEIYHKMKNGAEKEIICITTDLVKNI